MKFLSLCGWDEVFVGCLVNGLNGFKIVVVWVESWVIGYTAAGCSNIMWKTSWVVVACSRFWCGDSVVNISEWNGFNMKKRFSDFLILIHNLQSLNLHHIQVSWHDKIQRFLAMCWRYILFFRFFWFHFDPLYTRVVHTSSALSTTPEYTQQYQHRQVEWKENSQTQSQFHFENFA